MKKATLFLPLCSTVAVAQAPAEKKPAPKAAAKPAPKTAVAAAPAKPAPPLAQPLVIPKDAVVQSDGTYKYTDKDGRRWVYSNTFFGLSRMEDMSDPNAAAVPAKQAPVFDKVTADGDVFHFERITPFGPLKWDRRKAELSDEERQ